jgi:transcriptional regulator with XRE-family HTH domain
MDATKAENDLLQQMGRNLRFHRDKLGLSQLALSLKIGMSHNSINDIEHGKRWVSAKSITKLCAALEIEPYQLLLPDEQLKSGKEQIMIETFRKDLSQALMIAMEEVNKRYSEQKP